MELGVLNIKALKNRRRQLRKDSTEAECLLWKELRNNQIGQRFVRQFSVSGYVVDFYCPKDRLGIELEGGIHKRKSNKQYDTFREQYLKEYGVRLVKIPNEDVIGDIHEVIRRIREKMTCRTHPCLPAGRLNQREGEND